MNAALALGLVSLCLTATARPSTLRVPVPSVTELLASMLESKAQRNVARAAIVARGGDATAELVLGFRSPQFTVRWEVANILGITRDTAGIDALVDRVLHDDNPHIRWRSLWALGNIADRGTADRFRAALTTTDADVRWRAAVACSLFQATEALPVLQAGATSPDEFLAWEAVYALARLPDASSIATLRAALGSDRPNRVRREATLALGKHLAFAGAVELLEGALGDDDPEVRWRAARSLRRELPEVGAPLNDARNLAEAGAATPSLSSDLEAVSSDLADVAAELRAGAQPVTAPAPAVAGPPPDITHLIAQLRHTGDDRSRARDELIAAGNDAVPSLLPLFDDADPAIRWEMATILGAIADARAVPPLIERVLADPDAHVRWRSLFALAESPGGESAAAMAFRSELDGSAETRAWNAAVGLAFFHDGAALAAIYRGLGAADPFMRWEAVNALQRVHDDRAAQLLEPVLFGDLDPRVRREAVISLGTSCAPGAEHLLGRALHEVDPEIRWRAAVGLGSCGCGSQAALATRRAMEQDSMVLEQIDSALRAIEVERR